MAGHRCMRVGKAPAGTVNIRHEKLHPSPADGGRVGLRLQTLLLRPRRRRQRQRRRPLRGRRAAGCRHSGAVQLRRFCGLRGGGGRLRRRQHPLPLLVRPQLRAGHGVGCAIGPQLRRPVRVGAGPPAPTCALDRAACNQAHATVCGHKLLALSVLEVVLFCHVEQGGAGSWSGDKEPHFIVVLAQARLVVAAFDDFCDLHPQKRVRLCAGRHTTKPSALWHCACHFRACRPGYVRNCVHRG